VVTSVNGSSVARRDMYYSDSFVIFGISAKLDSRFGSSGDLTSYIGPGLSRFILIKN